MIRGTFIRFNGESGTLRITVPVLALEITELPLILIAITLANTLEPHCRLNGAAYNAKLLIVQLSDAITRGDDPLHIEVCSV